MGDIETSICNIVIIIVISTIPFPIGQYAAFIAIIPSLYISILISIIPEYLTNLKYSYINNNAVNLILVFTDSLSDVSSIKSERAIGACIRSLFPRLTVWSQKRVIPTRSWPVLVAAVLCRRRQIFPYKDIIVCVHTCTCGIIMCEQ